MPQMHNAAQFLSEVCKGVRWKKAHPVIVQELADHIADQKEAYLAGGMPPEEAEQEAVRQMGDPAVIGKQFDTVYRPCPAWSLLVCIGLLLLGGILLQVFVLPGGWRLSQTVWTLTGLAIAGALYFSDMRIFAARWVLPAYLLCLLLCGLFSREINGASISLSYLLLAAPLPLCGYIYRCHGQKWFRLLTCAAAAALMCIIALRLHASPGAVVMAGFTCFLLLLLAAGNGWFSLPRWQAVIAICVPAMLLGAWIVFSFSHRLLPVLFPAQDPQGAGFFPLTVRFMLSDAVLIGPGAVFSNVAEGIPTFHYSFLLTWLIARYGWIVMVPICAVFVCLIVCGAVLARRQNSFFGKLLCSAVLCVFALQVICYMCANCGLLFTTYFPLPLLCGGNYSALLNLPLLGVLLSTVRHGGLYTDTDAPAQSFIAYENGTLSIKLK